MRALLCGLTLTLSACGPASVVAPGNGPSGSPERHATSDVTLPPVFRAAVGWNRLPATVAPPSASGPCGQPAALKLASRIDPPTEVPSGRWLFRGCLYSEGNSFTQVFLELSFPDGTVLRAPIADRTPADRELTYEVIAYRNSIAGVTAVLYAATP